MKQHPAKATKGARGAKKSLGQHFLSSRTILEKICAAADITPGETVIEVGPGHGSLTRTLLATGAHVIAIEKDEELCAELLETFARERESGTFVLHCGDIKEHALLSLLPKNDYKVVANIPYYLTGFLIRLFLTAPCQPTHLVFLVQKEVAERVVRDPKESLLSLSVKAYGTPVYKGVVKAGSFAPAPAVDSAILSVENISRKRFEEAGVSEDIFFDLIKQGFSHKRKTLSNNLKHLSRKTLEECEIDPSSRPETVPLERWMCLASKSKNEKGA